MRRYLAASAAKSKEGGGEEAKCPFKAFFSKRQIVSGGEKRAALGFSPFLAASQIIALSVNVLLLSADQNKERLSLLLLSSILSPDFFSLASGQSLAHAPSQRLHYRLGKKGRCSQQCSQYQCEMCWICGRRRCSFLHSLPIRMCGSPTLE